MKISELTTMLTKIAEVHGDREVTIFSLGSLCSIVALSFDTDEDCVELEIGESYFPPKKKKRKGC